MDRINDDPVEPEKRAESDNSQNQETDLRTHVEGTARNPSGVFPEDVSAVPRSGKPETISYKY